MRLKDSFRDALGLPPAANAKGAIGAKAQVNTPIAPIATFAPAEGDMAAPPNAAIAAFASAESAEMGAEALGERAAIMATDAGLPDGWADALARVLCGARPANISRQQWADLHDPILRFADRHAAQLHDLGWRFEELFCAPQNWNRLDQRGIGWALCKGQIVHATSHAISFIRDGARYTHQKKMPANHAKIDA